MTDERLQALVRAALLPAPVDGPARDLWPPVASRLDERTRWSSLDLGLAGAAAATLAVFPEWLWLLAYHF